MLDKEAVREGQTYQKVQREREICEPGECRFAREQNTVRKWKKNKQTKQKHSTVTEGIFAAEENSNKRM